MLREYLEDTGTAVNEAGNRRAGRVLVLITTLIGRGRYMRPQMLDFIAVFNIAGHQDIFWTKAYSSKWRKIAESPLPGQTAPDQPDKRARAIQLRPKDLLNMVNKKKTVRYFCGMG